MKKKLAGKKRNKIYRQPKLINYGQLQELTAGGSGKKIEGLVGMNKKKRP